MPDSLLTLLARIEAADRHITALNRNSGPVWELLPALVERSNLQQAALGEALRQLRERGGCDTTEHDRMRLHGRIRALHEQGHA